MTKNYRAYLKLSLFKFAPFKFGCAAIGALYLLVLIAGGVIYARANQADALFTDTLVIVNADSEIYYDDLTIERGEVYRGDVIVYSGNIKIEDGGEVQGALLAYSGDITIEEGALVAGDVVGWSGDADIAGHIGGNLVVWSGDIKLDDGAVIDGDVSVMSGEINREEDAVIKGNMIAGPKLPKLPLILEQFQPQLPTLPIETKVLEGMPPPVSSASMNNLTRFILRLVGAAFLTGLIVFFTGLIYYLQPTFVGRIRTTLTTQKPTSFVIGLLINIVLTMFIVLVFSSETIFLAICLAPLSLISLLLFLILNTAGWAALSLTVGERLLSYTKMTAAQPIVPLLVGATVMTGTLTFVWALGGCMRPIAYLAMLTLTALGGGALIVQQLKKRDDGPSDKPSDQPATV